MHIRMIYLYGSLEDFGNLGLYSGNVHNRIVRRLTKEEKAWFGIKCGCPAK